MFKFRYWAATRVCMLESFLGIYMHTCIFTCMNSKMNGTILNRKREVNRL